MDNQSPPPYGYNANAPQQPVMYTTPEYAPQNPSAPLLGPMPTHVEHHHHQSVISHKWSTCPQRVVCPFCNKDIVTSVSFENGSLAWLSCLGICFFGGGLGCCLIPFCVESFQDVVHHCPHCKKPIGRKDRI